MTDVQAYHLTTKRLVLRGLVADDWRDLARIGGRDDVAPMLFSVRSPWPEADVKAWIATSQYRGSLGFRAAICLPDGELIGTVGIGRSANDQPISCAYFIDPAHWGQGYATEAMIEFLADSFERYDIDAVVADYFADNPASGAVLRKLGFQKTGESTGTSAARLEPAPVIDYLLDASDVRTRT